MKKFFVKQYLLLKRFVKKHSTLSYIGLFFFIYALIFLYIKNKLLFTPDFGESDAYNSEMSGLYLLWQDLHKGIFPSWTENIQGGYPIFWIGYLFIFTNFIFISLFSFVTAYNLALVSVFFLLSIGFFLLLKEFKVSSILAFLISLSFAFNGAISLRLVHFSVLLTFSLTPFLFYTAIKYIKTKGRIYMFLFPIILAEMIFAIFVQVVFTVLLGLFIFLFIYLKVINKDSIIKIFKTLFTFSLLSLIGVLYASPLLLIIKFMTSYTERTLSTSYTVATSLPLQLKNLINFILPYVYGNPKIGTYPAFDNNWGIFWENTPYLGLIFVIISFSCFMFYLFKSKADKNKKFILFNIFLILFLLLLALGKNSPLYLIYNYPPFNFFRTQSRFLLVINLFIFFVFALVIDNIYKKSHKFLKLLVILLLIANFIDLLFFTNNYHLFIDARQVLEVPRLAKSIDKNDTYFSMGQPKLWNEVFMKKGWSNQKDINSYLFFKNFLYPNSNVLYNLKNYDVYTSMGMQLRRPNYIKSLITHNLMLQNNNLIMPKSLINILDFTNIRYLILPYEANSDDWTKIDEVSFDKKNIYLYKLNNSDKLSRSLYYTPEKVQAISYLSDFEKLLNNNNNFTENAVVEDSSLVGQVNDRLNYKINTKLNQDDHVILEGKFENNGFLVLKKNWYPGWKLYINGKQEKIYKTNLVNIGFMVPKGYNKIELKFRNIYFEAGLYIAVITFVLYSIYLVYLHPKNRFLN